MMSLITVDTLICPKWIVPIRPRHAVLEQYAIAVKDKQILDILPRADAIACYIAVETVMLPEHIVFPGLINLHTHAAMSLMRGLADDISLMRWLSEHIWPAESMHVSEDFVRDGSLLACAEMLRSGTTCFADMYFFPAQTAEVAERFGMRACLGMPVLDFPTPYATDVDDYLNKGLSFRDGVRDNQLITTYFAPHAPYTVSNRSFEKILVYAEQLGLNIYTHLQETHDEVVRSEAEFGVRPLQRLMELGLPGPNFIAAHGVHLNAAEIAVLAEQGCHIAHCPASNLKLASGIAPIKALLDAGVNVGIGTDGAASNNSLDMLGEMRLAALLAKGASGDAEAVPAWQALEMATMNAAQALGLDQQIGSIEIGKSADIAALDMSAFETTPCYDPVSHLVYAANRQQITHVWVQGAPVLQNRQLVNIDHREIMEKAKAWQNKLQ